MRFPLRLAADLALGRAARALGLRRNDPLILNLALNGTISGSSPVVWIGGSEPLERAEIASAANSLAAAGRYVFLPTDGVLLRRRIHEFQPSSRLFLTIRFDGKQASEDRCAAVEAIRTAKLCGFLLCAQVILHAASDVVELTMLRDELGKLRLDGFLISPAAPANELVREVENLRRRLLPRGWSQLSRLLDSVAHPAPSLPRAEAPVVALSPIATLSPDAGCEESVHS
jgi:hypothetical protein